MVELAAGDRDLLREIAENLLSYETISGNEEPAQKWLKNKLDDLGFKTYTWNPDSDVYSAHSSFPPVEQLHLKNRPSVAGVLEFGDADEGRTLVLNGHIDVVPVEHQHWTSNPFEPTWQGERLIARGSVDMKSQLAMCIVAAIVVRDNFDGLDGRIVVESVSGEEMGGLGAATSAHSNPYPFQRDGVIVAEPTDLRIVTATEGSAMIKMEIFGRSAHAARRWVGEDVLPLFEQVRQAAYKFESERSKMVKHDLFEKFEIPWPIVFGRIEAGNWASSVPAHLVAEARLGVAPGETVNEVIDSFEEYIYKTIEYNDWLSEHPPTIESFGVQFEPAEIMPDEDVVKSIQNSMKASNMQYIEPVGETYGADSRHYIAAGIPTVLFGPGQLDVAHYPDESIFWPDVELATEIIADSVHRFMTGQ